MPHARRYVGVARAARESVIVARRRPLLRTALSYAFQCLRCERSEYVKRWERAERAGPHVVPTSAPKQAPPAL